jgi:phenylalanyl-tRNA synthetase beta chain
MKRILTGLDIEIKQEETDALHLSIPPYRPDVKREADVAEEILRIYGLNNIEIPTQVRSSISASPDEGNYKLRNRVADYLSNNGFYELTCNSLTKSAYYTEEELAKAVKILNPLSNDLDIMRMSMLYSGLEMLQYNSNSRASDIKCFEYGFTYTTENGKYVEVPHISVFITGMKQQRKLEPASTGCQLLYPESYCFKYPVEAWDDNDLLRLIIQLRQSHIYTIPQRSVLMANNW